MIRVGLRFDEAARKADLKIARLVGTDINFHGNSKGLIQRLENLVRHVALRDFVFVGPVKWLLNLMKRRLDRRERLLRFLSWALPLSSSYFGPAAEQDSPRSDLSPVKLTKVFCGLDVAPCPARDIFLFIEGKLPADFRRRSEDE